MPRILIPLTFALASTLGIPWLAAGQEEPEAPVDLQQTGETVAQTSAATEQPSVEELRDLIDEHRALLDKQSKELQRQSDLIDRQIEDIEAQRQAIQALQTRVDQMSLGQGTTQPRTAEEIQAREEMLADATQATPEMPEDILRAGDFPGSIHLPGTNLNAKLGGFVRIGSVSNFDAIGSDDRFVVGSIPPEGTASGSNQARAVISAKRSRMNIDVRMDSTVGQFRAFVEGDFAGDGGSENYRLRHAFGQYQGLLMGKTWSTLQDLEAIPEEVDFEGISGQINVRQALLRIASLKLGRRNWAVSLEDPQPSLSGGEGVGQFMDVAGRTKLIHKRGHVQLGLIFRTLAGEPTDEEGNSGEEDTAYGYGISIGGAVQLDRTDQDNLKFQLNVGNGLGRYINDLASVGGQDGVFDPETGELETLPVLGTYVAYQRWWQPKKENRLLSSLRSTFVYSYVYVDNFDFQEPTAYNATQRTSFNLLTSPISSLDLGMELLWGSRRNKDSSIGDAVQFQLVATFRF